VRFGSIHALLILLSEGKMDPDLTDTIGDTSLHWLVKNPQSTNNIEMMRLLLHFGGQLRRPDGGGDNCLHSLASGKYYDTTRVISRALLGVIARHEDHTLGKLVNSRGELPSTIAMRARNYVVLNFLMDLTAYYCFPRHLPVVLCAASVCMAFVGLHFYGWLGGFLAFSVQASHILTMQSRDRLSSISIISGVLSAGRSSQSVHHPAGGLASHVWPCLGTVFPLLIYKVDLRTHGYQ
jgi:hypothetical protein